MTDKPIEPISQPDEDTTSATEVEAGTQIRIATKKVSLRISRARCRKDTLERFVPFVFDVYDKRFKTFREYKVLRSDLELRQRDVAARMRISVSILSKEWSWFSLEQYGEQRFWPGPETEFYRRYVNREDGAFITRDQHRQWMVKHRRDVRLTYAIDP